jgi:cytochrome c-type biogenesis protein CcmH/NrfG
MAKMIRVPDEYHAWVKAHNRDDETMFETLRRLTREPDPEELQGILTSEEVAEARRAAEQFGGRDTERFARARDAFADDS